MFCGTKRLVFIGFILLSATYSIAQSVEGTWAGSLQLPAGKLRIGFTITKTDKGWTSVLNSPDQGAMGIPTSSTSFENGKLSILANNLGASYAGTLLNDSTLEGKFTQGGQALSLNLGRTKGEAKSVRPQEPRKPYPYYTEEVVFENKKDKIKLAGTLSLPTNQQKYPVVVLISGSGAQNRDEEILGHKPFLVLSDYLVRNGIGVLRFDDRGTAKSGGMYFGATSSDFASDVEAAVEFLKKRRDVDSKKIGLIGHSEGGYIAPMVAARNKHIKYIVMMAGLGIPGDQLLLAQEELVERKQGMDEASIQKIKVQNTELFNIIRSTENTDSIAAQLNRKVREQVEADPNLEKPEEMPAQTFIQSKVQQLTSAWMIEFIKTDPATFLEKVKCPVLAINGAEDIQVPSAKNLYAIKAALSKAGNADATIREFPELNHLFQKCTTCGIEEYGQLEETLSPTVLTVIAEWVLARTKE